MILHKRIKNTHSQSLGRMFTCSERNQIATSKFRGANKVMAQNEM
jgi:hypothetical protein